MRSDLQLLTLAQWFSPAYPLGSFAWSHGLENAVAEGWIHDAPSLRDWIAAILTDGSGRSDATLMRFAHAAEDDALDGLNRLARAFAPSAERRVEAERQGAAFARTTSQVWHVAIPDLLFPVAVGRGVRLLGLDIDVAVPLHLQTFSGNLVAVAQRLLPLGQMGAQSIVADLCKVCATVAIGTRNATRDDLFSNAFLTDIAAMRHETQSTRLFQS